MNLFSHNHVGMYDVSCILNGGGEVVRVVLISDRSAGDKVKDPGER
jgi:hypothetical protein